jgi:hypothetical protein
MASFNKITNEIVECHVIWGNAGDVVPLCLDTVAWQSDRWETWEREPEIVGGDGNPLIDYRAQADGDGQYPRVTWATLTPAQIAQFSASLHVRLPEPWAGIEIVGLHGHHVFDDGKPLYYEMEAQGLDGLFDPDFGPLYDSAPQILAIAQRLADNAAERYNKRMAADYRTDRAPQVNDVTLLLVYETWWDGEEDDVQIYATLQGPLNFNAADLAADLAV